MASVTVVQPAYGRITVLSSSEAAYTLRWDPTHPEQQFRGFKLYCHACNHNIAYSDSRTATFYIDNLEDSGHPGPFEISCDITGESTTKCIYVKTVADDPLHGSTRPYDGSYKAVYCGYEGEEMEHLVTISATPTTGYRFDHWSNGSTSNPMTVRLTRDGGSFYNKYYQFTAYFTKDCTVTMAVSPEGTGTTSPAVGQHPWKVNEPLDISATAADGYKFIKWSDGSEDPERTVYPQDNVTYTAIFVPSGNVYKVSAEVHSREYMGYVDGVGMYAYGDVVTLTAVPNKGFKFDNWSRYVNGGGSKDPVKVITVTGDSVHHVAFVSTQCELHVRLNQKKVSGTVRDNVIGVLPEPYDIDYAQTGQRYFKAIPNTAKGWRFLRWSTGETTEEIRPFFNEPVNRFTAYFGHDKLFYDEVNRTGKLVYDPDTGKLMYPG